MGFLSTLFTILGWLLGIAAVGLLVVLTVSHVEQSKRNAWGRPGGLAERVLHPKEIDLQRYAGRWYEIASTPNPFQRKCLCSTANYTLDPATGTVAVLNRCQWADDEVKEGRATAWPINDNNTWLRVNFIDRLIGSGERAVQWPFNVAAGDYWILHVDDAYTEALVGSPDGEYLWILSRAPTITKADYHRLATLAASKGYKPNALRLTCRLLE